MNLFELTGRDEANPAYQALVVDNGNRQYDFIRSLVQAALTTDRPFISATIIKSLNFQAIACLHSHAGEYRPCPVRVGDHVPPDDYRVDALMEDLINRVNRSWEKSDPVALATFVLWALNHIHPFINGNGRTARAASYFILCVSAGGWLSGKTILPELLRQNRDEYCKALNAVDASVKAGKLELKPLHEMVVRLLDEQMAGVRPSASGTPPDA